MRFVLMKEETHNVMTRPWSDIRAFYEKLPRREPGFDSMRNLVEEIIKSRYVSGIYAWTSMHTLCIVQTEVRYPYSGPRLMISPTDDGTPFGRPLLDGKIAFRYIDTNIKDKQWHRTVEGKDGFARLEKFFYQLHWFYPIPSQNRSKGSKGNEE
jgi:hypothetical protein